MRLGPKYLAFLRHRAEAEFLEQGVQALPALAPRQGEAHVLLDGPPGQQPRLLEHRHRFPEAVLHGSCVGFQQSQGNAQQSGLSHTGRSHQRDPAAGQQRQIPILQNGFFTVTMGNTGQFKHRPSSLSKAAA